MDKRAAEVLEINSRLRRALAEVAERESTIRHQAERLALLNDFARAISSTLDLDSVFTLVTRQVAKLLDCPRCAVCQLDPQTGELLQRAVWEADVDSAPPDGESTSAPIAIGDTVWGELSVSSCSATPLVQDRVEFLNIIASHLALAIRNAELYTQVHDSHQELVVAQRQLIQQERLRALGEMASGIAHDLNNALAPVLGFSELLSDQPEVRADPKRLQHYLSLIMTGASDAAAVVKRLREFYRPRDDAEALTPVDLNALVQQTIALSEPKWRGPSRAEGRVVDVHSELRPVPPAAGHQTELREMLMNLIFNAVDACPYGGTITVRTRRSAEGPDPLVLEEQLSTNNEHSRSESAGVRGWPGQGAAGAQSVRGREHVVLEVQDDGLGMSEEVKQRCLEPFFTTKGEQGTGMGMAMVYGTVKRHGGQLEIQSALGKGTTVRVFLSQYTPEAAEGTGESGETVRALTAQTARLAAPHDSLRVLVADDEPLLRAVVGEFLTASGHAVDTAITGDQAWEMFRAGDGGDYDLVITDRAMPGMGGEQLAVRIKMLRPTMPVILLTGFGDLMNAANTLPAGVDVVLGKPVTLAALRAGIAAAMERVTRKRSA